MKLRCLLAAVCLFIAASPAGAAGTPAEAAGTLENGVLMVNGRPFFPLGSWNSSHTTPQDIASLGMNMSFRCASGSEEGVAQLRQFVRECGELGLYVTPYLSYGGSGTTPWPEESGPQDSHAG